MPVLLGLWLVVGGLVARSASAFTVLNGPFTAQATLVGGFPTCTKSFGTVGPLGGLDDGTAMFFTDFCTQTLYRFGEAALTSGASALSPAASSANGLDSGVALSHGTYYGIAQLASTIASGLYAFDPVTLKLTTSVPLVSAASFGPGTPKNVTADPASTDIYVSSDSGIYRVQNPLSTSPTVTQFASGNFDGLAFNSAGTALYAAHNVGVSAGHITGFARNRSSVFDVNVGGAPDGLAVAPVGQTVSGMDVSNNVFVNNNNGDVQRIDTNNGNAVSAVAAGGTRGDFAFVDSQGGLDVSQADSYVRLSPAFFGPSPAPAGPPVINAPANNSLPVITGGQVPGTSLVCSTGTWSGSPGSFSFQWRRDALPIPGATAAAYTIVPADRGHALACAVTAANVTGSTTAISGAVFVAGPPTCSITARLTTIKATLKVTAKAKVEAIKLAVRCNQDARARITGSIRHTFQVKTRTHRKSKSHTVTLWLRPMNIVLSRDRITFVRIKLDARLVKAMRRVQHATANLTLNATSAQGTTTSRATLTLGRSPH
jgi:hypothetical protein